VNHDNIPADEPHAAPAGIHLPRPTIWPMVMAAGIVLALSGLVLTLAFTLAGLIVFAIALAGWIRELRRE
jgi:hypothetical protein